MAAMLPRCATVSSPQGGPKDSLPPLIVMSDPAPYTVNFTGKKLTITFNEYVQLKDQSKIFFMSPAPKRKPTLTIKNRSIVVEFRDSLEANTTYRLDFGGAIVDINEGNKIDGYSFVFSTGPVIDSLMMVGQVVDAFTRDTVIGAFVNYFDAGADSVALDSVLFKSRAEAIFRTDSSGYFVADILREKPYRIYAFLDTNGDQNYQPGTDLVGFADTTYNPTKLGGFTFIYDSTERRARIDSLQVVFELFKEKASFRQNLMSHSRTGRNKLNFVFAAPDAKYDSLVLDSIDNSWLIEERSKNGDSITLWIAPPTIEQFKALPDSIKGSFVYQRQDSVLKYYPKREKLSLNDKVFVKKEGKKSKKDTIPEPVVNPFKFTVNASQTLNPEQGVGFVFDLPIRSIDSSRISLIRFEKDEKSKVDTLPPKEIKESFYFDSLSLNHFILRAKWKTGAEYELMIPSKVFNDIGFMSNDTLASKFTILDPDKFGTITIHLSQESADTSHYIIDVYKKEMGRSTLVQRRYSVLPGQTAKFQYLPPGKYTISVTQDKNRNKEWDTGVLDKRITPEKVRVFVNKGGSVMIEAKENWDINETINLKEMFR